MTRILLNYLLPIVLPTAVYFTWVWLSRRRRAGGPQGEAATTRSAPWFWLICAGFTLMAATLVYVALTSGHPPGLKYQAPHYEGGKVIPGQFK